ncbi:LPS assembly protein LptD [Vibrio sp. WXL103]|uniref:LPS assembly protein LptD n=1 Tax=Vibrio sp. WXL103 TaxID=3450710 RepID=UPI003EC75532
MSRFSLTILASSISAALYVPTVIAASDSVPSDSIPSDSIPGGTRPSLQELPTKDQCLINDQDIEATNQLPINVEADSLEATNGETAVYQGDVIVTQGNRTITADSVTFNQEDDIVVASGNVTFSDGEFQSTSDQVTADLITDEVSLVNTRYQMLCEQGRGEAVFISKDGRGTYKLSDGTITSCPEGNHSWRMRASTIEVDQEEEQATLYGPRFEVLDVPIFYVPYMTLPLNDARKTGLLYPTFSYGSSDGAQVDIPVYWNLAENYDLTTTFRYLEKRGLQLDGEFRYLSPYGLSTLDGEYLGNDQKYDDQERWGFQFEHDGIVNEHWKLRADYSRVSDVEYFQEVDSRIGNREDGQLVQEGSVSYRSESWDTTLSVRDFQVLADTDNQPYRLLPQITANYYAPNIYGPLDFDLISHVSVFDTDASDRPTATRVHIEPGFTLPIGNPWATWTTEARLLATHYEQDFDASLYTELDESVTRILPEFRTHTGLVLERDTSVFLGYTQTLEPQLQYVYVPEKDQSNIFWYDTTLLQTDYYGLFRSRQYSGVDNIASANQLSYGASSRFFDTEFKERLAISFGQIFYIDRKTNSTQEDERSNYSAWAVEIDFKYGDNIFYHGGIQYDIETTAVQHSNSTLEYRRDAGFVQANYRFVSKDYINETVGDNIRDSDGNLNIDEITKDGISQVGLLTGYQINRNWNTQLHYFYDLTIQEELEWLANLTYTDDCWYIGFTYSNQLRSWSSTGMNFYDSNPVYENNLSLNIGIIGFGKPQKINEYDISGSKNSLGYGRPFVLND